jgi:hypothetical protein
MADSRDAIYVHGKAVLLQNIVKLYFIQWRTENRGGHVIKKIWKIYHVISCDMDISASKKSDIALGSA